jgi:hypothetical protein
MLKIVFFFIFHFILGIDYATSQQEFVDCTKSLGNYGCDGGLIQTRKKLILFYFYFFLVLNNFCLNF